MPSMFAPLSQKSTHQEMSLILVNPPVVSHERGARRAASYLDLMVGNTPRSNYFSIPIEHLGLLSIKAYAASKGLDVHIVNGVVNKHVNAEQTLDEIFQIARTHGSPALIGFSQILAFEQSVWLARECKRRWPAVATLFGHDFATLNWQRILINYDEVDYVSIGEGEAIFEQLARCLLDGDAPDTIPGLANRDRDSQPVLNTVPQILNLDELPWPSREELPQVKSLGFSPAVAASRGCPYRCTYCTTGQVTRAVGKGSYRCRSPALIAEEMTYLWQFHDCEFINICDDLFVTPSHASRMRAEEFARELIRRDYRGTFMLDARVDSIEPDLFRLLYQAGLRRVFVGVETGSDSLLESFDKRYILRGNTVEDRLSTLVEIGIEVIPGIISCHPTASPDELRATLRIMEFTNFRAPHMLMSPIIVFPGTTIHEQYRQQGFLVEEWPIGLWKFADNRTEQAFKEIARAVQSSSGEPFDLFSEKVRTILDQWELDLMGSHLEMFHGTTTTATLDRY